MRIKPTQKTTNLGTALRFEISRNPNDSGKYVFVVAAGSKLWRVAPDNMRTYKGPWRLDSKVGPFPWESPAGERFDSPQDAAKALVARLG